MTSSADLEFDFFSKENSGIKVLAEHRYPWKSSEMSGIAIFLGLGVFLMITVQPIVLGGAVVALTPYMLYLNFSRKKKSKLLLADTTAGLRVYKDGIAQKNPTQFHLNDIMEIGTTKDLDGNCFIVLRKKDTRDKSDNSTIGFKIPERIYANHGGRAFLWGIVELNSDIHISDEAGRLLHAK